MVDVVNVTYWIWNPLVFLAFYLASFSLWYFTRSGKVTVQDDNGIETTTHIKNPFWLGLLISCFSFFVIGLYSLIVIVTYSLSVLIVNWINKFKKITE